MKFLNINKRKSICIGVLVTIALCSLLIPSKQAWAQSKKLIEAAKKEGKMTWFSSIAIDDGTKVINAFQKKYPFIKARQYHSVGSKLMYKVMTEAQMGKYFFDAISGSTRTSLIYKDLGIIAPYQISEKEAIPNVFKEPEGYWNSYTFNTHVIAYNTKMISPVEAPRNYQDLLDPKWKGKLGIDNYDHLWFAAQEEIMGKEKAHNYFRRLAKQNLNVRSGHTLLVQLCIAGEFPIVVNAYAQRVEKEKSKGAPVEWVGVNPVVIHTADLMMGKYAPHPNAARLFIDFMLSREGQQVIRGLKRIPTRSGVLPDPPRLLKGLKLHPIPAEYISKNQSKVEKQWQNILKGR